MKTVTLTEKEWKALRYFLEQLSEYQSNAGCNDLPRELREMFTKEEGTIMATEFAIYNNPKDPEGPDWTGMSDSCLLALLDHKIQQQIQ
jgi:hypothetical protein